MGWYIELVPGRWWGKPREDARVPTGTHFKIVRASPKADNFYKRCPAHGAGIGRAPKRKISARGFPGHSLARSLGAAWWGKLEGSRVLIVDAFQNREGQSGQFLQAVIRGLLQLGIVSSGGANLSEDAKSLREGDQDSGDTRRLLNRGGREPQSGDDFFKLACPGRINLA
ncbi:hypothetical protein HAX54_003279 [Datura stramonium]|uniref:Uncharacterized protein n=1 Tax=Datura stramonium TaxID=4076 RepID=A0ABS8RTG9_DATST|nr:hypothetical protein [Datura stramonium]